MPDNKAMRTEVIQEAESWRIIFIRDDDRYCDIRIFPDDDIRDVAMRLSDAAESISEELGVTTHEGANDFLERFNKVLDTQRKAKWQARFVRLSK